MDIDQLATHYKSNELPAKAYSTREGYKGILDTHILPKWGKQAFSAIKGVIVENWLKKLNRLDGKPASPA